MFNHDPICLAMAGGKMLMPVVELGYEASGLADWDRCVGGDSKSCMWAAITMGNVHRSRTDR